MYFLDQPVAASEVERRNVDLPALQADRIAEIASVASLLQLGFGNDPNRLVWSRAVDADNLAPAVINADEPKQRVSGLGFQFCREAVGKAIAPRLFGEAIHGIDASGATGADQTLHRCRSMKTRDIPDRARRIVFEVRCDLPRMRLDAVAGAQQQRLFQVAIAQPADRGYRDRDQQDHRDGQSGAKVIPRFATSPLSRYGTGK